MTKSYAWAMRAARETVNHEDYCGTILNNETCDCGSTRDNARIIAAEFDRTGFVEVVEEVIKFIPLWLQPHLRDAIKGVKD